ncbi:MAG: CHAT domain-containing protein [Gammaproteobacteria bacterium]
MPWLKPPGKNPTKTAVKPLNLDQETLDYIHRYIEGVAVPDGENTIGYAVKLDHGIGRKELAKGNRKKAFEIYRKILAISYHRRNLMGIAIALGVLSDIASDMDNPSEALKLAMLNYKVALTMNNRLEYGVAEIRVAGLLRDIDRSMSIMWFLKARKSLKDTRYKQDFIQLMASLSNDLFWIGKRDQALNVARENWEYALRAGNGLAVREARTMAARTFAERLHDSGDTVKAAEILEKTMLEFEDERKGSPQHYWLMHELADYYGALDEKKKAEILNAAAYNYYDMDRSRALGDQGRALLDNNAFVIVNRYIDSLLAKGDYYGALALLETNKARTLADIAGDSEQRQIYERLTALQREHARQRLDLLESTNGKRQSDQLPLPAQAIGFFDHDEDKLWEKMNALTEEQNRELQDLSLAMQAREFARAHSLESSRIKEIQRKLDKSSAFISFYASDKSLSVFLVTRDNLHYFPELLEAGEYQRELEKLRTALINPFIDFYREPAARLGQSVIEPIVKKLKSDVTLLIYSPDGLFSRVPLGVLPIGNQYLAEKFTVAAVPSLNFIGEIRHRDKSVQTGISCVDPAIRGKRLPFQGKTGSALKEIYGANLKNLEAEECRASKLEQTIAGVRESSFLHIGTHGVFYADDAMQSGFLLSGDGKDNDGELWNATAIAGLDLSQIELITLSSCETGLKDPNRLRDLFGIPRALLFSGAGQIVAPLWAVHDLATSRLMQRFYRTYSQGTPPAESLRRVQSEFIHSEDFAHPYYWAGFVVTGGSI